MALRRSGVRLPLSPPLEKCVLPNEIKGETHFLFLRGNGGLDNKTHPQTMGRMLKKCLHKPCPMHYK